MIFIRILKFIFPQLVWRIGGDEKTIYLTFDDGPIPEVTPWVLEMLSKYNAKATFFCVGENVKKNPTIYSDIIRAGHSTGNHTMHHLNGWKTENQKYFSNVDECSAHVPSKLFRPPYGRMKLSQIFHLKKKFRIIMWDVLSKDYDQAMKGEECVDIIKNSAGKGSIIVFHDSLKAESRLKTALPETLKYFSEKGYSFSAIR